MKTFLCIAVLATLSVSVGYGAHDLTCYEIIEPDTGTEWIEAGVPITPTLGIANLGDQAEVNLPVQFVVIDEWDYDTVFADTTIVDYIGSYPDSIEVEFEEWIPEGLCDDWDPFRYYELLGVVSLYSDDDRDNDTVRHEVTCLLSHDVGVIAMEWPEPPDEPPDHYDEGSKITVTATVENFGYHEEYDIHVRMEVRDVDSNDICIWHNRRSIDSLDWRGNESGNPYTIDVVFPTYDVLTERRFSISCCTELETDACPDNDCKVRYPPGIVEGAEAFPECFSLEIPGSTISDGCHVKFAVPHTSWVKLDVFDAGGRWVKSIENDVFEPGRHSCSWDRCDACGRKVAAGVYLVRMEADEFNAVRKVVVVN
ncbi:MAG: FlgD immunoglobulin-like domain containing protein, partial [candidate division WOR-3 bacterium]|nr:FlgD immunoglobulin-like domain containing protein [candidate division WOR-3 bacterium]